MKKWIACFILGWIVGAVGAFLAFIQKQPIGYAIMTVGDLIWLYSMYRIIMKRAQSS